MKFLLIVFSLFSILSTYVDSFTEEGKHQPASTTLSQHSDLNSQKIEIYKTKQFIKKHEGFRSTTYIDTKGYPTIGYGFVTAYVKGSDKYYMSRERAEYILDKKFSECMNVAEKRFGLSGYKKIAVAHLIFCKGAGTVSRIEKKHGLNSETFTKLDLEKHWKYSRNRVHERNLWIKDC